MSSKKTNILIVILAICSIVASVNYIQQFWSSSKGDDITIWYDLYGNVVERVSRSVVAIEALQHTSVGKNYIRRDSNSGSGFIFDSDGYIITNEHVIHNTHRIRITLADKRQYIAEVVAADRRTDIAVLKIDAENLDVLLINPPGRPIATGQVVIAMGNPLGTGSDGKPVATFGHINRLGQTLSTEIDPANDRYYDNLIQTSAITLPGSSGGPLVNELGYAIGIITAMTKAPSSDQQFGFAITLNQEILDRIDQLRNRQVLNHAFLGLELAPSVDQETQDRLGLTEISGALVESAILGFPAYDAGVRPGDLIRAANGQRIYSREDLIAYINHCKLHELVQLELLRGSDGRSRKLTLSVKLTGRDIKDIHGFQQEAAAISIIVWGMKIKPLTNWRKNIMSLDPGQNGVLVYALAPDSPADDFNIEAGAIITEINGNTVDDLDDFIKLAQKYQDDMPNIKFLQPRPTLDSIEDL